MKVYRVAQRDDITVGPYDTAAEYRWMQWDDALYARHVCLERCPPPISDGIPWDLQTDDYFGFATLTSLRKWFTPKARACLANINYAIHVLDVPEEHVTKGGHQLIFKLHQATQVTMKELA